MGVPGGGPGGRSSGFGPFPGEPGRFCARDPPWGRRGKIPPERLLGGPDRPRARSGVHIDDFRWVLPVNLARPWAPKWVVWAPPPLGPGPAPAPVRANPPRGFDDCPLPPPQLPSPPSPPQRLPPSPLPHLPPVRAIPPPSPRVPATLIPRFEPPPPPHLPKGVSRNPMRNYARFPVPFRRY